MEAAHFSSLNPAELAAFSNYPAATPPPGVVPNFVDPENVNRIFYGITGWVYGLMLPFFLNRLYVKFYRMKKFSWDDCTSRMHLALGV